MVCAPRPHSGTLYITVTAIRAQQKGSGGGVNRGAPVTNVNSDTLVPTAFRCAQEVPAPYAEGMVSATMGGLEMVCASASPIPPRDTGQVPPVRSVRITTTGSPVPRSVHALTLEQSDVMRADLDLVRVSAVLGGVATCAKTATLVSSPIAAPPSLALAPLITPAMTTVTVPAYQTSSVVSATASPTTAQRTVRKNAQISVVTTELAPKAALELATAHAIPVLHNLIVLTVLPATMVPPAVIYVPVAC